MTDQPDLQAALIPLAEKAGEKLWQDHGMCPKGHDVDNCTKNWIVFSTGARVPGRDGTLTDAEVTVVLGWLADVDYDVVITKNRDGEKRVNIHGEQAGLLGRGNGDTLNAALAAAVLALHEAKP